MELLNESQRVFLAGREYTESSRKLKNVIEKCVTTVILSAVADLPNVSAEQVKELLPSAESVEAIDRAGQKLVFRARIGGTYLAIKVAKVPTEQETHEEPVDTVSSRAMREIQTMRNCTSPYMVKQGPIGLTFANVGSEHILYFSEEYILGKNLGDWLKEQGLLNPSEAIKLGLQITDAIKGLWELGLVHRDIKPKNIMKRTESGDYVLLDAGLAFDVVGESLSKGVVGTLRYLSPEQFDYGNRRALDFRSDMFALGITLYELITGNHPFATGVDSTPSYYTKLTSSNPEPPSVYNSGISKALDEVILRMLGKSPHLRYRKCDQLISALMDCED